MKNLDNIRMVGIKTSPNGVVNHETIFTFRQYEDKVIAKYAGGKVLKGFLTGRLEGNVLRFNYCQQQVDGRLDHGRSTATLSKTNGKVLMTERFEWRDGLTGENVFEEI